MDYTKGAPELEFGVVMIVWLWWVVQSLRNTTAVPRHWSQKRKYLQGKRGLEKPAFVLPDFIEATGAHCFLLQFASGRLFPKSAVGQCCQQSIQVLLHLTTASMCRAGEQQSTLSIIDPSGRTFVSGLSGGSNLCRYRGDAHSLQGEGGCKEAEAETEGSDDGGNHPPAPFLVRDQFEQGSFRRTTLGNPLREVQVSSTGLQLIIALEEAAFFLVPSAFTMQPNKLCYSSFNNRDAMACANPPSCMH